MRDASPPGEGSFDWDHLYRRYAPDLRRLIARQLPQAAPIDDVLQETFVRAYRSRHRFDPTQPEWPWLATLAHRSCVKWWRTHRPYEPLSGRDTAAPMEPTSAPGSDDHVRRLEQTQRVADALAQLMPRHRRVLYLREAEDFPYEHLARDEQLSYKALKSLLARARTHFRRHYDRLFEESAAGLAVRELTIRFRSRVSGQPSAGALERLGPIVGMATAAGIMGILSMSGSAAPAAARAERMNAPLSSARTVAATHEREPTSPSPATTLADRTATRPKQPEPGEARPGPSFAGGLEHGAIAVRTGGGLTHGAESENARFWIDVDDPISGRSTGVGHEVRCEAGKVYTVECTVLRAVPSTG